jgi:hypothetical protein
MIRRVASLALLLAGAVNARAQAPEPPIKLTLRPAAAPTPALKYVLLPELADMRPGNAALHYQRAHSFEWWDNIRRQPFYFEIADWLDRPLEEVRDKVGFVQNFSALKEVDRGARRENCEWEMTQRLRKEGISMLIPDVQGFREYAVLLAMRCRLEIADRDYPKAIYTLQTGFALGRHVSDAPTLIHALVGSAICSMALGRVEELIQAPDSPNLYWALTDLPRPLIDLRKPLQGEKLTLQAQFPDLKNLETEPLSPQAQKRMLKSLNDVWFLTGNDSRSEMAKKFGFLPLALKAYPPAKRALIAQGRKAEDVAALPVLQVILIDALQQYRRLHDDVFKWVNVPYPQARAGWKKADEDVRAIVREHPAAAVFVAFVPALQRVHEATLRLDRRVAALRCIEALRLYAAAHGGKLPAKLSDITEVPVPDDPVTGKGFLYEVNGDRVTLRDPPLADGQPALFTPLRYELTFRR